MTAFADFLDRYGNDPVLFVREVLGVEPDPWQAEVLRAVGAGVEPRIAIRSGNGVGKTACEAFIIVWALACVYPQHTLVTAPSAPQLFGALAKEVKIWMSRLPQAIQDIFEVKTESIHHKAAPNESLVEFRTSRPETPEALAGVHMEAGRVFLLGDEASGIPDPVLNAATGAMSGTRTTMILAGNPTRLAGTFYDAFHKMKGMWHTIHVPSSTCPRVTKDFEQWCLSRGKNHHKIYFLGEFPDSEGDSVIPREWVQAALYRDVAPQNVRPIWGVDVAYKGGDRSALAKRKGNVLLEKVDWWQGLDTMETVAHILADWEGTPEKQRPSDICVDAIGIGAGVAHRLRELGLPAREINVAEASALKERYPNLRAELAFTARDWFETKSVNLCGDIELAEELCFMERQERADRKDAVKAKRETVSSDSEFDSPDLADAFLLTFAVRAITASGSFQGATLPAPKRNIPGLV